MTGAELIDLTMQAVDEDPATSGYYTRADCLAALNEGQRLLSSITLAIERRGITDLASGQNWYPTQDLFPNFLVPLRVQVSTGVSAGALFDTFNADQETWDQAQSDGTPPRRVRPARLADLDAQSESWQNDSDALTLRYGSIGWSLLFFWPAPSAAGTRIFINYAGLAADLADDATHSPEFPPEYHQDLVDYAAPALRIGEGAEELARALPRFQRFLESAQKLAAYVRARSTAARYDTLPFELRASDLAKLIETAKARKKTAS